MTSNDWIYANKEEVLRANKEDLIRWLEKAWEDGYEKGFDKGYDDCYNSPMWGYDSQ